MGGDRAGGAARRSRKRVPGRNAALIAAALGAFLLTSALMLRFYVHERLAVVPSSTDLRLRMVDEDASYLDTSTWRTVEGAEVVRQTEITGGVSAGNADWATWEMSTDTTSGSSMIGHMDRRVIVDRTTGRAVNCCGEHVGGDRAVRQAGLVLYWPAGAEPGDRPFYDADVRSAPPMRYTGAGSAAGVPVHEYVQEVEATQVPDSARKVPASALGLERRGTVTATVWLEVERTYRIEPVSGRLVDAEERRGGGLRGEQGGERTLLDADLSLDSGQVSGYADAAGDARLLLRAVHVWAPIALGSLGALALAAAPILRFRARDEEEDADDDEEDESEDGGGEDGGSPGGPENGHREYRSPVP
ncbi:DUF3068 domain-containing protein [Nocardiopsis potens]|uniref:DUF3068 domain-containing protein n=1 Tax=Nocardiopsis potens TaxID=1246458 RepID=UPI0003494265|nr:DUF3068 domain-containing protein [Nocardiopsis potens]